MSGLDMEESSESRRGLSSARNLGCLEAAADETRRRTEAEEVEADEAISGMGAECGEQVKDRTSDAASRRRWRLAGQTRWGEGAGRR